MNTQIIRGCGKQAFTALRQLAKDKGHKTLADVIRENKCQYLHYMRR